jgi:hypothetical protein
VPIYEFRYFIPAPGGLAREEATLGSDEVARAKAARELLRMPGRLGVEVWVDNRLVWRRLRGDARKTGSSPSPTPS